MHAKLKAKGEAGLGLVVVDYLQLMEGTGKGDKRIEAFRHTTSPAARKKMYPDLVRWFQEEGSLVVFSNEVQRYWMKPNVHGSVPLPSLELRFEDSWLA